MFCPHCGKEVAEQQPFCQHCGNRIASAPGLEPGTLRSRTAWEDRETRGALQALAETVKKALFSPSEFFRAMNVTGGLTQPLLFAMIMGMAGVTAAYTWQVLLQDRFHGFTHDMGGGSGMDMLHGPGLALLAVLMPFVVIFMLFFWSGLLHVLLMMVRGEKNGFEATFRAIAYGYSTNVFLLVPFCGWLIAGPWSIVLAIIGLKEAHGTTGGKASFAVFFPLLLCCGLGLLVMLLVFGTIAASLGTLSQQPWK